MDVNTVKIRLLNYDEVIAACRGIMEVCDLLDMPLQYKDKWVTEYISKNLQIGVYEWEGY